MNYLNQIILEGNAVDKAVFYEDVKAVFHEDATVAIFTVSVERTYKNSNGEFAKEVSYFDVKTFGRMAEVVGKEITKGRGVRIVGRLSQEKWTDSDGKECSKVMVIAEHIAFNQ